MKILFAIFVLSTASFASDICQIVKVDHMDAYYR
jgi:hypothetical protein